VAGPLAPGDYDALAEFLREHHLCEGPLSVTRIGDGHSNLTYAVSDGPRTVVVRRPPPPPAPPGAHDVLREARLMDALRDTAVPVPAVLATAQAGEVFDVPCYDLSFDDGLDLRRGRLEVTTRDGDVYRIAADAAARGGYMSGGGYGGQHGRPMGGGHLEHDIYPLDGSVSPRTLDSALTDRLAAFTWDGIPGSGIFEFALTRSPAYAYQSTLPWPADRNE
jgi:phosphotransferase family enzyme